jgi:hypothetical protein
VAASVVEVGGHHGKWPSHGGDVAGVKKAGPGPAQERQAVALVAVLDFTASQGELHHVRKVLSAGVAGHR